MIAKCSILASLTVLTGLFARPTLDLAPATFSLPLHYNSKLRHQGFPSPLVRLRVGDHEAVFIVDTGASVNTVAAWFAREARLNVRDSDATVSGSTGHQTKIQTVSNVLGLFENRIPVHLTEANVVDFPPVFQANRLGGLLSPQLLASNGEATVLNLRVPSLKIEPFDSAIAELGLAGPGTYVGTHACTNCESLLFNRQYMVPVSVSGVDAILLLDTGATHTLVTLKSRVGQSLTGRSVAGQHTQGVGGTVEENRSVSQVRVEFAGAKILIDNIIIGGAATDCGPDGLVGMDALRSCVLVLGKSTAAIACQHE
jgi:hypothetical protein